MKTIWPGTLMEHSIAIQGNKIKNLNNSKVWKEFDTLCLYKCFPRQAGLKVQWMNASGSLPPPHVIRYIYLSIALSSPYSQIVYDYEQNICEQGENCSSS